MLGGIVLLATGLGASTPDPDASFDERFRALVAETSTVFAIRPPRPEVPGPIPARAMGLAVHVPPLLERADLDATVDAHRGVLAACYTEALRAAPGWRGRAILDVVIRKNGRVAEVSVRPAALVDQPLGRCLLRRVARWRFPPFSGETEPGLTREAITASFPLRFQP